MYISKQRAIHQVCCHDIHSHQTCVCSTKAMISLRGLPMKSKKNHKSNFILKLYKLQYLKQNTYSKRKVNPSITVSVP
jgi:hypothetical protein